MLLIGMFLYYRNEVFPNTGYAIDTISTLFVLNIMTNKFTPYIFFQLKQTTLSLLMILFVIGSGIAIAVIFAINDKWVEFTLFLFYITWCCFLLYINSAWLYVETYMLLSISKKKGLSTMTSK